MMNKGSLTLVAVLFAVIIFGSTVFLSASSESSDSYEIYNRGAVLKSIEPQDIENPVSWMKDLDKVIPPEDRQRIAEADPSKLNTTERFVQSILFKNLDKENLTKNDTLSLSESDLDPSEYEQFYADFIKSELQSLVPQDELFYKDDLEVQKNPSKEDITLYGNAVGEIIQRNSPDLEHEKEIFKKLIEKGGRQGELDLRKIAEGYKRIANETSQVSVPEEVSATHLLFINQMKAAGLLIENMSFIQQDPLRALIAFNQYLEVSKPFVDSMNAIAVYFEQQGISYSSDEYGSFFVFIKNEQN